MKKRNIYFVQPTFMNTNSMCFPYAAGALVSYARSFKDIKEAYEFKKCFIKREKPSLVLKQIEAPFMVAFSTYMWNFEYNKVLARLVKEAYPECKIVFGGPQISPNSSFLEKYSFIDVLMYSEGEVPFRDLLRAYNQSNDLNSVNNISWRNGEAIINTPIVVAEEFDFPSPYQTGFFDMIVKENPDIDFTPLIETNRGCPNKCTYCSWGTQGAKVRTFPLERVFFDLEWTSKNQKEFVGFTDANFGILPRDEVITDKIIELNHKHGYPKKFQVSYSKNSDERVFRITQKLNQSGMDKGVTLSFQSMSPVVQANIGRSNMYIEHFEKLLAKYSEAGIPTYTDLILGLPGETTESFKDGIETLLEYGQHTALFIHLCEWLPCSEMGNRAYMEKYALKFKKIPLNQPHSSLFSGDEIQEYSRIITSTYSMTESDWIDMVMCSTAVLCFHHLGLLQIIALYLYNEKKIRYIDFYNDFLNELLRNSCKIDTFKRIKSHVQGVISDAKSVVVMDERFGNIAWPFEEFAFLDLITKSDLLRDEVNQFLKKYIDENTVAELVNYQMFIIKTPKTGHRDFCGNYAWKPYFDNLLKNKTATLTEADVHYTIDDNNPDFSLTEYAKKILWFGRRGGNNIYTKEIQSYE